MDRLTESLLAQAFTSVSDVQGSFDLVVNISPVQLRDPVSTQADYSGG
jgi:hypothetical protein